MHQIDFIQKLLERHHAHPQGFPDKQLASAFIDRIFSFLFTPLKGKFRTEESLLKEYETIRASLDTLLLDMMGKEDEAKYHADSFFKSLPGLYQQLLKDASATLEFDPAAISQEEVLIAYPGFYATAVYRLTHQLYVQDVHLLPRFFSEYAHSKTGIDIHPGAAIGASFVIDHGTGVVIGESAVIGDHVKIYQGVTIGALNVAKELAKIKRHPTIGDHVIIYSGATILGGETNIGRNSIIGGNVWLTHSVEPYSVVYQKSEVIVRDKFPLPEPLNFVI